MANSVATWVHDISLLVTATRGVSGVKIEQSGSHTLTKYSEVHSESNQHFKNDLGCGTTAICRELCVPLVGQGPFDPNCLAG